MHIFERLTAHLHLKMLAIAVVVTIALTIGLTTAVLILPTQAATPVHRPPNTTMPPGTVMPYGTMMPYGMMSGNWISGTVVITETMSMAEMGAILDQMQAHMSVMLAAMPISGTLPLSGTLPVSGTVPVAEMGQMMQVMGLMQQRLGQMHMLMGAMMSGGMMGPWMMGNGMMGPGMMGSGMMDGSPWGPGMMWGNPPGAPEATVPEATVPEATVPEAAPVPQLAVVPVNATAGAISISVTPWANPDPNTIAFDVALNSHSVELDFDLAEHAALTIGAARYTPTAWEPNTVGGHHVSGTLIFTLDDAARAALTKAETVELTFDDMAGAQATVALPVVHE